MLTSDKPYTFDRVVRMVLGVMLVAGLIWLASSLSGALIPFVAALLLAYLLNPATCFVEKILGNRALAVAVVLIGTIALCTGIVMVIFPAIIAEFVHMGKVLGQIATNAELGARIKEYLPDDIWEWLVNYASSPEVRELFTSEGAQKLTSAVTGKVMPGIAGFAKGALSFFGNLLTVGIILLYLVFLLADFGRIRERWQDYLPRDYRDSIATFLSEFEVTMSQYFRGQVTIALLVGVLLSTGFVIIDLPLAILLGMLTGILNIAPYLGTIGILPAALLGMIGAVEAGDSPLMGLGLVLLVFCVVQAIQEIVLIPKIQGDSLGLTPWMIVLSLSIWGQLLGFLGLLIALPMTCLCLSWYRGQLQKEEAKA